MAGWDSLIGSPRHLFVFEAAARLGSFTAAAAEIGVSQPAVSQCVRQLEQKLGTPLFLRGHRSLALTVPGERLYTVVSGGVGRILRTAESIRNEHRDRPITLSTSSAFAHYWAIPRLAALRGVSPELELRVQVTDRDVELEPDGRSLGVRRGEGNWPGYGACAIAEERLLAVASEGYLERTKRPERVEELLDHQLIHLEEPIRYRPVWQDWFAGVGVNVDPPGEGLRLNDYALVLQAAMAGEGIALGWWHIVDRLLEKRLLEPVLATSWVSGARFWLVWNDGAELSLSAECVRDWVIAEARRGDDPRSAGVV